MRILKFLIIISTLTLSLLSQNGFAGAAVSIDNGTRHTIYLPIQDKFYGPGNDSWEWIEDTLLLHGVDPRINPTDITLPVRVALIDSHENCHTRVGLTAWWINLTIDGHYVGKICPTNDLFNTHTEIAFCHYDAMTPSASDIGTGLYLAAEGLHGSAPTAEAICPIARNFHDSELLIPSEYPTGQGVQYQQKNDEFLRVYLKKIHFNFSKLKNVSINGDYNDTRYSHFQWKRVPDKNDFYAYTLSPDINFALFNGSAEVIANVSVKTTGITYGEPCIKLTDNQTLIHLGAAHTSPYIYQKMCERHDPYRLYLFFKDGTYDRIDHLYENELAVSNRNTENYWFHLTNSPSSSDAEDIGAVVYWDTNRYYFLFNKGKYSAYVRNPDQPLVVKPIGYFTSKTDAMTPYIKDIRAAVTLPNNKVYYF